MLQLAFNTFNSLLNLGEVEDRVVPYFEIFYLYAVVVWQVVLHFRVLLKVLITPFTDMRVSRTWT